MHSEFELNLNKIMNTIIDNGSNMVKAFKIFGRSESDVNHHQIINIVMYNTASYNDVNNEDDKDNEVMKS